jgi:hypothetical protein
MKGGERQSSLGRHAGRSVVEVVVLSVPFIGRRVGRKGVGRGCTQR